ncbi:hypothetical protein [Acinetobacter sp.]|uniref:hypothetical protein n=1 Tax=Acinetobacter sp. TaxID=472 RepID=UPI002FC7AC25
MKLLLLLKLLLLKLLQLLRLKLLQLLLKLLTNPFRLVSKKKRAIGSLFLCLQISEARRRSQALNKITPFPAIFSLSVIPAQRLAFRPPPQSRACRAA